MQAILQAYSIARNKTEVSCSKKSINAPLKSYDKNMKCRSQHVYNLEEFIPLQLWSCMK